MQPDEASGTTLLADAAALDPQSPPYLTALFHRVRLLNGTADPATLRPLLDAVLARTDLTTTARNLFLAERMQLAGTSHAAAFDRTRNTRTSTIRASETTPATCSTAWRCRPGWR